MKLLHQYSNFFGEELNRELYMLAVSKNEIFTASKTSNSKYHPGWRKSKVMYDSQFTFFKNLIEKKIREKIDEIYRELELIPFEIGSFEVQLTSHNDGEYFKWHRDNSSPETSSRRITFVYYFHAMPKPFSGGELIIYHGDEQHPVEPVNDSIVFFDSARKHEVKQVICPGGTFRDGRFTLNGWIRCRTLQQLNSSYFGYNIFAPFKTSKYGV